MGVPTAQRICRTGDFAENRRRGRRVDCGVFLLRASQRPDDGPPRLGVIASRKVGNAVQRHRGKRRIRELFRLHQDNVPRGWDVVVILRRGMDEREFGELRQRYLRGLERALPRRG